MTIVRQIPSFVPLKVHQTTTTTNRSAVDCRLEGIANLLAIDQPAIGRYETTVKKQTVARQMFGSVKVQHTIDR